MRTTLTLDDDVAALLARVRKASRQASLREIVNEALRHGLRIMTKRPDPSVRSERKASISDGVSSATWTMLPRPGRHRYGIGRQDVGE